MNRGLLSAVVLVIFASPFLLAQEDRTRFEVGPVFNTTTADYALGYKLRGLGGRFTWRIGQRFSIDACLTANLSVPSTITNRDGGRAIVIDGGPKFDLFRYRRATIFVKAQPGIVSYSRTFAGLIAPDLHVATTARVYPVLDIGGGVQMSMSHRTAVRVDYSEFRIFYLAGTFQNDVLGIRQHYGSYAPPNTELSVGFLFRF